MLKCLFLALIFVLASAQHRQYFGGVVVPGRSVPSLRFFEFYVSSCKSAKGKELSLEKLSNMLKGVDAESIADKVYRDLYFMVDDLDVKYMMGKWFVVVDSPGLHFERCTVINFELLSDSEYTATFSVVQHSYDTEGKPRTYYGTGEKYGVDPGNIFIHTGQPNDICPYFPTKVGPINEESKRFEYIILTQALKHPTIVLARNPRVFEQKYKKEVMDYLKRSDFMNPLSALNYPLQPTNISSCLNSNHLYYEVDSLS